MRRHLSSAGFTLLAGLLVTVPLHAQTPDTALKQETPGLLAQAGVTPDSARAIALRAVPGGVIQSSELERERRRLVYSFDIKVAGKDGIEEILVDARTGRVIANEHEDPAAEAAEHAREARTPKPAVPAPRTPATPATPPARNP